MLKFFNIDDAQVLIKKLSLISIIVVLLISIGTIIGWLFNVTFLKSISDNYATMKPLTAFSFILITISIIDMQQNSTKKIPIFSCISIIFILAVTSITIAEYFFEIDFQLSQFFLFNKTDLVGSIYPGRMALATAISFFILNIGVSLFNIR